MNRSELAAYVLLVPLIYATWEGLSSLPFPDLMIALGELAAMAPLIGLWRSELLAVVWVPGFFLFILLFTISGVATNDIPGPLGGLIGGWAAASPLFVGIGALTARNAPGPRAILSVIALLAAVTVVSVALAGPYQDPATFANAFVRLPREQAQALGAILTGGSPSTIPLDPSVPPAFLALALLGGAGALSGLLAVDPRERVDALGFERSEPSVPEGTYRSLFPEGRERLKEGTPEEPPTAPELPSLASLLAAVLAGVVVLSLAVSVPNDLLPGIAGAVVVLLLWVALTAYRTRPERTTRAPIPAPTAASGSPGPTRL